MFKSYDPDNNLKLHLSKADKQKQDIFSLAIICLQMMTLSNMHRIYDFDEFKVNVESL